MRPDHCARIPQVKCLDGVGDDRRRDRPQLPDHIRPVACRIDSAEKAQAERVVRRHIESLDEVAAVTSDVVAELAPEDAHKHRLECVDGAAIVAGGSSLLRDSDEGAHRRVGG